MNTNSNSYTIIYASVMVIIVAFLLAFVSSTLKPLQDANVAIDKKSQILASLNIRGLEKSEIEPKYDAVIVGDQIIKADGTVVNDGAAKDEAAFKVDSKDINENNMPLYVANVDGATKYVIPVTGRGLWGGLWGYIALNEDCKTVFGAYMSHASETAGLGALLVEPWFQERFLGKKLFKDGSNDVALTVVKAGAVKEADFEVDGITGATLTTNGVAAMVKDGLQKYIGFINTKTAGTCCNEQACEKTEE
ncbi:MAG: NADH:ubiquinone reductase (Na(+)-transporting) subunit C [Bacteroidaceae bacterium]|nr:NADH:ubiquinone reductase (Na(+)-transporting) subunit C [Bacteroidaceae bacterium]MBQ3152236.1 NADH:ubiquinone reductase (Na(+)-transporting) subunit C [Bacteroidaceae bacterium]MBR6806653.1 NADH:ubiquinone reductase (Na(+)-transporting) subunit C [Bacteroidaceae bacterium]